MSAQLEQKTLENTVLGLLIERPSYGYELYDRIQRRLGDLVSVSYPSAIYAALNRLERAAMIERSGESSAGTEGRPRIYFRTTGSGASTFRAWLAERMRDDRECSELITRLAAVGTRRVDAMLDLIDRYEQECLEEARLSERSVGSANVASARVMDPEAELIEDLLAEERRRSIAAQLSWLDYARDRVRAYATQRFPSRGT